MALSVSASTSGGPFTSAKLLTPGATVAAGAGVCISASAPVPVSLIMQDGSVLTVFAAVGTMVLPGLAVIGVQGASTAIVYILS